MTDEITKALGPEDSPLTWRDQRDLSRTSAAVRQSLVKFSQRPNQPRGIRFSGGVLQWEAPQDSEQVTHYRIYANTEANLVREVPVGQLFLNDNLTATQVFVSAFNRNSGLESIKVLLSSSLTPAICLIQPSNLPADLTTKYRGYSIDMPCSGGMSTALMGPNTLDVFSVSLVVPATANRGNAGNAIAAYAQSKVNGLNPGVVAVFGSAIASGTGSSVWGANFSAGSNAGTASVFFGCELDVNVNHVTDFQAAGLWVTGGSQFQVTGISAALWVGAMGVTISPKIPWKYGYKTESAAAINAIDIGPAADGNSKTSQFIFLSGRNSSGVIKQASAFGSANGDWFLRTNAKIFFARNDDVSYTYVDPTTGNATFISLLLATGVGNTVNGGIDYINSLAGGIAGSTIWALGQSGNKGIFRLSDGSGAGGWDGNGAQLYGTASDGQMRATYYTAGASGSAYGAVTGTAIIFSTSALVAVAQLNAVGSAGQLLLNSTADARAINLATSGAGSPFVSVSNDAGDAVVVKAVTLSITVIGSNQLNAGLDYINSLKDGTAGATMWALGQSSNKGVFRLSDGSGAGGYDGNGAHIYGTASDGQLKADIVTAPTLTCATAADFTGASIKAPSGNFGLTAAAQQVRNAAGTGVTTFTISAGLITNIV